MIRDWWDNFDMAEKFFIELSLIAIKFAAIASLAGCGVATAKMSNRMAEATVIVADVDMQITRPKLPDQLAPKGSTGAVAVVTPQKSILLLTKRGCNPCQRINTQTIPALKKTGWLIEEYDPDCSAAIFVVETDRHPELVTKYGVADEHGLYMVPQWILCEGERVIRRSIGFKTDRQVREFWNLKACTAVKAVSSEPVHQVQAVHHAASVSAEGHWDFEGDRHPSRSKMIQHLDGVHGQDRSKLEAMSNESLLRLHDALHDRRTTYRSRTIRKSRTVASACPGGRCP